MKSAGSQRSHAPVSGKDCFGCKWARRWGCLLPGPADGGPRSLELRVRGEGGVFRVVYFTATAKGVLVFHAFAKKTQRTHPLQIELAEKRLEELLDAWSETRRG